MPTPRLLLFSLLLHLSAHSAVAATDIIDASIVSVGISTMNTVTNKRFHIVFTRIDSLTGDLKELPVTVAEITGFVVNYSPAFGLPNTIAINEVLSSERLARYGIGVGKYTAQAWVSQRTDSGLIKGPVSNPIEFTIWDKALVDSKNTGRTAASAASDLCRIKVSYYVPETF